MTDHSEPKLEMLTGKVLRERSDEIYANLGDVIASMKQMSYVAGGMDAASTVAALLKVVERGDIRRLKTPPDTPLDAYTLRYVQEVLHEAVQETLNHTIVSDVVLTTEPGTEGPPPGTRPS